MQVSHPYILHNLPQVQGAQSIHQITPAQYSSSFWFYLTARSSNTFWPRQGFGSWQWPGSGLLGKGLQTKHDKKFWTHSWIIDIHSTERSTRSSGRVWRRRQYVFGWCPRSPRQKTSTDLMCLWHRLLSSICSLIWIWIYINERHIFVSILFIFFRK